MLKKNDKYIQHARLKIQQYLAPNVIQYTELEKRTHKLRLQRIILQELGDGSFCVRQVNYNCRYEMGASEYAPSFYSANRKHNALNYCESLVTELEQIGYEVTDEFEAELCSVARQGWNFHSPTFQSNIQFFGDNHHEPDIFLFQKLPAGLQVVVMIDDQGKMTINDLEQTSPIIVNNLQVHGNARCFLSGLSQQDGFRSLILEAVFDGENLYVTDGSYIHDVDLTAMPFEKRYSVLSKYMNNTQNNQVCGLIEAQTLASEKWGGTARNGLVKALMARRKDAIGSLYRTSKDSASAIIIGEREPVYYDCVEVKGNTAILRKPTTKTSTFITYPIENNRMMLKSLHVIGPANTTELAFMF